MESISEVSETKKMPMFYIWAAVLLLLLAVNIFWVFALQHDYFGGVTDENSYIHYGLTAIAIVVLRLAHCSFKTMARNDGVL